LTKQAKQGKDNKHLNLIILTTLIIDTLITYELDSVLLHVRVPTCTSYTCGKYVVPPYMILKLILSVFLGVGDVFPRYLIDPQNNHLLYFNDTLTSFCS